MNKLSRIQTLLLLLLVLSLLSNLWSNARPMAHGLKVLYLNRNYLLANNEKKLCLKVGESFCNYVSFIKQHTSENATILIPPQGYPWPMTGNVAYFRYFLYQRVLINGKEKEPGIDLLKAKIDYVLIDWGEDKSTEYDFTHGWPKFSVPTKQIVYMDTDKKWGIILLDLQKLK